MFFLWFLLKDFGINTGLAARLEGMSIDNLGAFNTYRDESDDDEFDAKQSGRDDLSTLNALVGSKPSAEFVDSKPRGGSEEDVETNKRREMLAEAAER